MGKDATDATTECYTWAADGQCAANPDYMLTSCKYSCWEWFEHRRKKYPDAPIDKRYYCQSWAKKGECTSNAAFMKANCPESCKKHADTALPDSQPPSTPSKPAKKKKKKKKSKSTAGEEAKD